MDKEAARTRNKIKKISSVKDFENLLSQTMLSDEEKQILRMHYHEKKPMSVIADTLGMAEVTVKKKHSRILSKITNMF